MRNLKQYVDGTAAFVDHTGLAVGLGGMRYRFTVNAESANSITVNVEFVDPRGRVLARKHRALFWVSSTSDGLTPSAVAVAMDSGGDGHVLALTPTGQAGIALFNSSGKCDVRCTQGAGASTRFLCMAKPSGGFDVSSVLTWT